MKTLLNKIAVPILALIFINIIGLTYHYNYEGAVVGSVVGMIVGFLASEIRAKF
jgi:hypothetical protein